MMPDTGVPASGDDVTVDVDRLVRRVAVHGLPAAPPIRDVLDAPLDDDRFGELLRRTERHRVTGHLMDAVESGALPATASQAEQVAARHEAWCASMLLLERELLQVIDRLEANSIEVVVLKGSAAAHLGYPDPALRLFGDNDILVRSHQIDRALHVLAAAGYARRSVPARPDFDRRFGKGATLYSAASTELDVHRSLVFGSFGFAVDLDELWDATTTFRLAGRELTALDSDAALLHAMFHAALGDAQPQLGVLRDLAQRTTSPAHDPERVVALARRWRAMPVVKRAVSLLEGHLEVRVDGPIAVAAAAYRPTSTESRAVASYVAADRSFTAMVLASLPYLPSMRERVAFLRAVAMPSTDFIATRGIVGGLAWWRQGLRRLARGGRR